MKRLSKDTAKAILAAISGQKVMVFGDLMLDEYLFGEVNRISPEAPVPIVRVTGERWVLGGAANVASNLRAIGAEPLLVGLIGKDEAGERVGKILSGLCVDDSGLVRDPSKPTIIKTRVIGQHQQMLRIDREESGPPCGSAAEIVHSRIGEMIQNASAVIVSDYAKGTVEQQAVNIIRELAISRQIPWIVDPKPAHKNLYVNATAMTPNTKELSELVSQSVRTDDEIATASSKLVKELQMAGLLVTRSEKGMALLVPDGERQAICNIPTEAKEVFDVSGAGDTVIATFTAALAAKADWMEAAMLANIAAGVVVAKMGTATATPQEILDRLS